MSKQSHEETAERDLDEWDAEIEAEFQRLTRGSGKTTSKDAASKAEEMGPAQARRCRANGN